MGVLVVTNGFSNIPIAVVRAGCIKQHHSVNLFC